MLVDSSWLYFIMKRKDLFSRRAANITKFALFLVIGRYVHKNESYIWSIGAWEQVDTVGMLKMDVKGDYKT